MTKELKLNFSIVEKKIYLGLKYQGLTVNTFNETISTHNIIILHLLFQGPCGHDHIVVGFTTTYAVSAYHH